MNSLSATKKQGLGNITFFNGVSLNDKVLFISQTATMLHSGLHLTQALTIIQDQVKNKYFKDIIGQIKVEVEGGNQLSQAMLKFPDIFDRVIISIVRSGEASGQLDTQLQDLGGELERQGKFIGKIKAAMAYPMIVIIAMIAVALLATFKIIPAMRGIIEESGGQLPLSTRIVLGISDFFIHDWLYIIIGLILFIVACYYFFSSPSGQSIFDRFLLKEPTGLAMNVYMTRFTRTLGMLIQSGVPIIEAIKIVSQAMNNEVYSHSLKIVAAQLERGIPLSVPISKDPAFPAYISQMMVVGEQTGQIDKTLLSLANYYESRSDAMVKNLSTWLEPIIIIIIGIGVGFLVFAILMPVYNAALSIK
jgi:type IV pilus assembly protein PilC